MVNHAPAYAPPYDYMGSTNWTWWGIEDEKVEGRGGEGRRKTMMQTKFSVDMIETHCRILKRINRRTLLKNKTKQTKHTCVYHRAQLGVLSCVCSLGSAVINSWFLTHQAAIGLSRICTQGNPLWSTLACLNYCKTPGKHERVLVGDIFSEWTGLRTL